MSDTDLELLAHYATRRAEDAFSELVRRHLNLVYSAALRQVRSPQLAEEVAQSAFIDLARNAEKLKPDTILTAWLYQVTRRTAIDVVRRESSRQLREQIATEMNATNATTADWTHIEPLLDEAMLALNETDRTAVLLRYFENKSLHEVGAALGASEGAAQKRLTRAVERLREFMAKRDVSVGASGLALVISTNAVQAAPVGLAATISTATALAGTAVVTTVTAAKIAIDTMSWVNSKAITAVLAAALAAGTGTYLFNQREADQLRAESQSLMAQQASAANERDTAMSAVDGLRDQLERMRNDQAELLRLRGEVGQLRRQLESQKEQLRQPPAAGKAREIGMAPPGAYITKEQLAHVGYATPEAAIQTFTWAMMNSTYEQVTEGLNPEGLADELKDPKAREVFESRQKVMAPLFKGLQIVAKKILADDKVELKMKMDADPLPGQQHDMPPFLIQPMVKIGDAWRLGGSTRGHQESWDQEGQIQTHTP